MNRYYTNEREDLARDVAALRSRVAGLRVVIAVLAVAVFLLGFAVVQGARTDRTQDRISLLIARHVAALERNR